MCNNNSNMAAAGSLIPFGLKLTTVGPAAGAPGNTGLLAPMAAAGGPHFAAAAGSGGMSPAAALEIHRAQAQLYDYNARLRFGLHYAAAAAAAVGHHHPGLGSPYGPAGHPGSHPHSHPAAGDPMAAYLYGKQDPRLRYLHEEPKPSHSYIGLIAMAILSSKDRKLVLSDIYQWILDNYPYFRTRGPGWRNSIRHNLSLNDCFIKSGRSANGKGHYWAIHPANVDDFSKGDFRRRRAQRKVRKAMGLAVPDEEDSPSPPPPANLGNSPLEWQNRVLLHQQQAASTDPAIPGPARPGDTSPLQPPRISVSRSPGSDPVEARNPGGGKSSRRLFDVESLLAPDCHTHQPPASKLHVIAPLPQEAVPGKRDEAEDQEEEDDSILEVDMVGEEEKTDPPLSDESQNVSHNSLVRGSEVGVGSRSPSPVSAAGDISPVVPAPTRLLLSPPGKRDPSSPSPRAESPRHRAPSPGTLPHAPLPTTALHRLGLPGAPHMWSTPAPGGPTAAAWERPTSAFHAFPGAIPAWGALHPHGYPMMAAAPGLGAPGGAMTALTAPDSAHKWQEAFSRIMARAQQPDSKSPPVSSVSPHAKLESS